MGDCTPLAGAVWLRGQTVQPEKVGFACKYTGLEMRLYSMVKQIRRQIDHMDHVDHVDEAGHLPHSMPSYVQTRLLLQPRQGTRRSLLRGKLWLSRAERSSDQLAASPQPRPEGETGVWE